MKLNEDVLLKIYNEFLNSDLETKSNLRHSCPFIYRNYYDARFIEINNEILKLYFNYLLSKPKCDINDQFQEYQKTFHSFQNFRLRNITSSCIEYFFEIILKKFKANPNILCELNNYYQKTELNSVNNVYRSFMRNFIMLSNNENIQKNRITTGINKHSNYIKQNNEYKLNNNKKEVREDDGDMKSDDSENEDNDNEIDKELNKIPFRLFYNNNKLEKTIIQSILKFSMEQGFQQNLNLSYDDFTYQQRMALEGLFEAFYNILHRKLSYHLSIIPNFIHLKNFELYNCQFNYNIFIPWSPHLTTIKVIDSRVKLIVDGSQCPRLKHLIVDEEASIKFIGKKANDFDHLERLQLRNINFHETQQLPLFNHLKSLRLNNYPSPNITIPTMNDLQELFIQDNQLCENIYIKPQPNLKFLRLWNFHSCLNLVNEDINYIYSNYDTLSNNDHTLVSVDTHRLSTLSTSSNFSVQSSTTSTSSTSMFSDTDFINENHTYFPKVEYLRLGYCSDLLFIKQISQRISTITIRKPSISYGLTSSEDQNQQEKKRLRRFNLLFPNLKTLVIERSCDLVDYLKWFIPTLTFLNTLIFKDCYWGGGIPVNMENLNMNMVSTSNTSSSSSNNSSNSSINSSFSSHIYYDNSKDKMEEESEEDEQERIEQILLRSNNLQAVLQKMRLPSNLSKIIFINCSEDLTKFIQTILKSRRLSIKFTDIQCNEHQLKQWWTMF